MKTDSCLDVGHTSNVDISKRVEFPTSESTGYPISLFLGEDGFVYEYGWKKLLT